MLVIFDIDTSDREAAATKLCALTESLVSDAIADIKKSGVKPLYKAGVKYLRQNPRACAFRMPSDIAKRSGGDCKQLSLWRIAELRMAGENAKPRILWLNNKKGLQAHMQVRRADESIEDPSLILGMGKKERTR